jgi:uncharacterized membrane protein
MSEPPPNSPDASAGAKEQSLVPAKDAPKTLEQIIQEKAPGFLNDIPGAKRAALAKVTIERHEISMRGGPLPHPSELAAYNQIIPNGADRIMKMAEDQSNHRMGIEKIVITSQQRQGFCGQLFGLIIGLVGLGLATYAAISGQPVFGAAIGGATLVSLVSAFLYSNRSRRRESEDKREMMAEVERQIRGRQNNKKRRR